MSLLDKGEISRALMSSTSTFNLVYICSTSSLGNILKSLSFFFEHLILLLTKLCRPNMNGLKLFPNFVSNFHAMNTSKYLLTKSIKQSIIGSSMIFDLVFIPSTNNRFFGDLSTDGMKSLKVTRHASFPISIVSPIELGWTTTPPGHSLGF